MRTQHLFIASLIFASSAFASGVDYPHGICGNDDRISHQDPRIGRIQAVAGSSDVCTATMIGPTCAISAGHCVKHLKTVEFNVPASVGGLTQRAAPQNIYPVDMASIAYANESSDDWAVFQIKKNTKTQKTAGQIAGYYRVKFDEPQVGQDITISGFGLDDRFGGERNFTLQTDHSDLLTTRSMVYGRKLSYRVDSRGGSSGSAIIRTREQDIIGVHTNGGCNSGDNYGTSIAFSPNFAAAIRQCLARDL